MNKALWLAAALIFGAAQAASFQLQGTWAFSGHQGEVEWATLTPDGERVYTQSGPQLLAWDARTGSLLNSREPAPGQRLNVLNSDWNTVAAPAGQRVLVSVGEGEQQRLRLLDLTGGRLTADFGAWPGGASAQWTPGQTAVVLTTFEAPQVRYWRQTDEQVRSLTLESLSPSDWGEQRAVFAPDASVLYVLGQPQGLTAYDPATGRPLWWLNAGEITGRNGQPLSSWKASLMSPVLSHNPARPQLLLSAADGLLLLNTQGDPEPRWLDRDLTARAVPGSYTVTWSEDGGRAFISVGGFTHEIDTATGQTVGLVDGSRVLAQAPSKLWTAAFGKVAAFDRRSGLDEGLLSDAPAWNSVLALDAAGEPAAALLKVGRELAVQDYKSGRRTMLGDHFTRAASFSPDGKQVASVGPASLLMLDAASHKTLWQADVRESYDFAFSPDGQHLALGERGQTRLLDAGNGQEFALLRPPSAAEGQGARGLNRTLAFSPSGEQLVIGYEAGAAAIWNVAHQQAALTVSGGQGWVLSAAFSPDGRRLALGYGGGEVRTFALPSGKLLGSFTLSGAVRSLAFSPDGSLAAGSLGGDLRQWDSQGTLRLSERLEQGVTALTFAGERLVVGDRAGQLYGYAAGQPRTVAEVGSLIQSLDWNAARRQLLVSSRDNALRVYTLEEQP
ncbi:PQQ-binding-like beta-propeller repeat protein [Deinococcus lacus]|uniref:PQQ-binding-like beta-propeller repeat protein n=1 Tax=Deinococcus lacus TaxID=392561 RepID=A0ABW1YFS6_9DEIO